MSEQLAWTDAAWKDYLHWQTQDKKTLKRVNKLITECKRNPFEGIGKPEPLKENLSGFRPDALMTPIVWYMPSMIITSRLSLVAIIINERS